MSLIAVIGYGLGIVCYFIFFVLLISSWRGRIAGATLVLIIFINALWCSAALAWHYTEMPDVRTIYQLLEVFRYQAWLLFIYQLLKPLNNVGNRPIKFYFNLKPWLYALTVVLLFIQLPSIEHSITSIIGINSYVLGMLLLSLMALVLIEHLYRYTRPDQLWAIKYLCLGMATSFIFDFYLYSDALLFNRINPSIEASRGFISIFTVLLMAVAVVRNPRWSVDLFVSRGLILRSFSIVAAGVYLLLMALAGYYIKTTGAQWSDALQLVFLTAALLALFLFIVSGQIRSRVKLFFNKHFFTYQYDYRDEWLGFTNTLAMAQAGDHFHEHAIRAIAELVDSNGGMLWTKDESGRFSYLEHWCMKPSRDISMSEPKSLIQFLQNSGWVVELAEYSENPNFYKGLELPQWMLKLPLLWVVVPLIQAGNLIGFVLLSKPRAFKRINWEDRDLLKTAGQQLASYVELYAATVALVDARQFEAFNRLSAFVVHDLKNICAQLQLVTSNAEKHKHNPEFIDDSLATVKNATEKIKRMLSNLNKGSDDAVVTQAVVLTPVLEEVLNARKVQKPQPSLSIETENLWVRAEKGKLQSILTHLIQNAQEATPDAGEVRVIVKKEHSDVIIRICDTGCGMSEEFIKKRLFRPFDTTKGNAGMGIGVYQSRETIKNFGGELVVFSEVGKGTEFLIRLACADENS